MAKERLPVEARRAGNLSLIHDSLGFVIWDLDDFFDNKELYYDIDHKKARQIEDYIYWIVCRSMGDGRIKAWIGSQQNVPNVPSARNRGVDTFAD